VVDINGARVRFGDGWGLVRASSNLPELVMVFEATTAEGVARIKDVFRQRLAAHPEVGTAWHNE
jgi:phosphomannomutase/phosphoglucomutase